jgi:hypothetical protein
MTKPFKNCHKSMNPSQYFSTNMVPITNTMIYRLAFNVHKILRHSQNGTYHIIHGATKSN